MRFRPFICLSLALAPVVLLPACRSSGKDKLETTIRARDQRIYDLQNDVDKLAGYNLALQTEVRATRGLAGPSTNDPFTPLYPVRSLVVGRSTTAVDDDRLPGDEGLQVVLEPRDSDGRLVRAPACATIMVMEVDSQGLKSPVGTWDFNAEQLRASWKQGLLTSGYVLTVGWQTIPRSSRIKILASFTLEDGRRFEAEKDLSIKPPVEQSMSLPGSLSAPLPLTPVPGPGSPPAVGSEKESLPVPAPLAPPAPLPDPKLSPVPSKPIELPKPMAVPAPAGPAAMLLDPRLN